MVLALSLSYVSGPALDNRFLHAVQVMSDTSPIAFIKFERVFAEERQEDRD